MAGTFLHAAELALRFHLVGFQGCSDLHWRTRLAHGQPTRGECEGELYIPPTCGMSVSSDVAEDLALFSYCIPHFPSFLLSASV